MSSICLSLNLLKSTHVGCRNRKREKNAPHYIYHSTNHNQHQVIAMSGNGRNRLSLFKRTFLLRAEKIHARIPAVKKIPLSAIAIILFIALINMLVWAICGVVLVCSPPLFSITKVMHLTHTMCTAFLSVSLYLVYPFSTERVC